VKPIIEFSGIKTRGHWQKNSLFSLFFVKNEIYSSYNHFINIEITDFFLHSLKFTAKAEQIPSYFFEKRPFQDQKHPPKNVFQAFQASIHPIFPSNSHP